MPELTNDDWTESGDYTDISYRTTPDGIALITIERPRVRNAFRPLTSAELVHAFATARHDAAVRVVLLTGAGDRAFCSGADLSLRAGEGADVASAIAPASVLDLQLQIRRSEIWFLCRQYDAQNALDWGLVNTVVPLDQLLVEGVSWARELIAMSPAALRMLKNSVNAEEDGLTGIAQLANDATLLYYGTDEAAEGAAAFMEKRRPEFGDKLAF
jgi:1,4-dihydroxy-2-naphthoyl-CoA synthase